MKRLGHILAMTLALFLATALHAATADETPGWYVSASAGGVFPGGLNDQAFGVQAGVVSANGVQGFNLDSGLSLAGQVGYQMDRVRVEGEFLWQNYGRSDTSFVVQTAGGTPTTFTAGGSRVDTYSGFLNGYYDFRSPSRFTPYLGAGIGITKIDAAALTSSAGVLQAPGIDRSVFAYQAKAGVAYRLSHASSMFLQYRYMGTAGFSYGGATVSLGTQAIGIPSTSGSLSNHAVELGLRLRL